MICTHSLLELRISGFQVTHEDGYVAIFNPQPFGFITQFNQYELADEFKVGDKLIGYQLSIAGIDKTHVPYRIMCAELTVKFEAAMKELDRLYLEQVKAQMRYEHHRKAVDMLHPELPSGVVRRDPGVINLTDVELVVDE